MNYAIQDAASLTITPHTTNKPILYADYCNSTAINFKATSTYAMKKGVKSIRFDKNKEGTFKTEMEVYDMKWIALLFGTSFITGSTNIYAKEVLNVQNGTANLVGTPITGSMTIFLLDTDKVSQLAEQTVGTPATTPNTYSIAGQVITLNTTTTFKDNNSYIVCYYIKTSAVTAQKLSVKFSEYAGNYTIVGDTMIRSEDGNDHFVQFLLPNAKPQLDANLSFSTDSPSKLDITWDLFPDPTTGSMLDFIQL